MRSDQREEMSEQGDHELYDLLVGDRAELLRHRVSEAGKSLQGRLTGGELERRPRCSP